MREGIGGEGFSALRSVTSHKNSQRPVSAANQIYRRRRPHSRLPSYR
jgi:hypothetical protein